MQARLAFLRPFATCALAAVCCGAAYGASTAPASDAPIVLAQAGTVAPNAADIVTVFPDEQVGVRAAAKAGPDALRQYILRTRMIYAFAYSDFAPRQ